LRARVYPVLEQIEGTVKAPPSKSYTHRALFISLLTQGVSRIENMLVAGVTKATAVAVKKFGGRVTEEGLVHGALPNLKSPKYVYCRGSGTTLRIATAVASLVEGPVLLYGNSTLNRRPMMPLVKALETLGARVLSNNGFPPIAVKGKLRPREHREVAIDASKSSQFVTALLIVAPILSLTVRTMGGVRSLPYIDITLRVMEAFGVRCARDGYKTFTPEREEYVPSKVKIPGDFSSASYLIAIGALAGRVRIEELYLNDVQGDKAIVDIVERMGAKVRRGETYVEIESSGMLEGVHVDCRNTPDLAPIVAVLGAYARGTTQIEGVEHLAFKESNRLESITKNLRKLGIDATVKEGRIWVRGGRVRGGRINSFRDHRIAMAFAVAAVRAERPIEISGFECYKESYPQFLQHLKRLGIRVEAV